MNAEFVVAVHAIEFLNHKKEFMSSDDIADNVCTNPARVRKILSKLEKSDLIISKSGNIGGYAFKKDADDVNLLDIFEAVCDKIINIRWRSGDINKECQIASGISGVMDDVFNNMEQSCKATLKGITISEIDKKLFFK